MAQKRKLQIFVSSTYEDLKVERQAAVEAILKAGHIPAGMELFTSDDRSQMEVIEKWIDESDAYVLILGGRYGSIEKNSQKSYTHLEFDYAIANNKPLFSVVIKDEYLEQKEREYGRAVMERENPQKLKEFLLLVKGNVVEFFSNSDQIKSVILAKMAEYNNRDDLKGWIPADEGFNMGALTEEFARLSKENAELREQLSRFQNNEKSPVIDIYFAESDEDPKSVHYIVKSFSDRPSIENRYEGEEEIVKFRPSNQPSFSEINREILRTISGINDFFDSEQYLEAYNKYLEKHDAFQDFQNATVKLSLIADNTGNFPGDGVKVIIDFPSEFFIYNADADLPEQPSQPLKSEYSLPYHMRQSNLALMAGLTPSYKSNSLSDLSANVIGPTITRSGEVIQASFIVKKLQHQLPLRLPELLVTIPPNESIEPRTWNIPYAIHAENLAEPVTGQISIFASYKSIAWQELEIEQDAE